MLVELVVSDLGVIEHLALVLAEGMTAVTGETGAGKTLVVSAIELLLGGRADPVLVRTGATEARVDGRFVRSGPDGADEEVVLTRVVPAAGRSRAYIDGRPVPATVLAERGSALVDLHGQHAHQTLLIASAQRESLDVFGGVDLEPLRVARAEVRRLFAEQAALGGDERARARELDLVRFQVEELEAAGLTDADEDRRLHLEEELLSDAVAHRESAALAVELLGGEDAARDRVASAGAALAGRSPLSGLHARIRSLALELDDVISELWLQADRIEDDPARLEEIRVSRQRLRELRRKYGDDLTDVISFHSRACARAAELAGHDARAVAIGTELTAARRTAAQRAKEVTDARAKASPALSAAIEHRLRSLGMAKARVVIDVEGVVAANKAASDNEVSAGEFADDGSAEGDVRFLLSANPGTAPLPMQRVASGGELARIMLALRLALLDSPDSHARSAGPASRPVTLVFDEVDAGIGGTAATAVGSALADLAEGRQVLVVTHLAQVAAHADHQVLVAKSERRGATATSVAVLGHDDRIAELARMLSGMPDSASAKAHAQELLAARSRATRSHPTSASRRKKR